jgi:predicted O-methyltransferase YrrM
MQRLVHLLGLIWEFVVYKLSTPSVLKRFGNNRDVNINKLYKVFDFLIQEKQWSEEEIEALEVIDGIRNAYSTSTQTINVQDFGSGNFDTIKDSSLVTKGVEKNKKVSEIYLREATNYNYGFLIFKLIRDFKPKNCLELGTSLGISASYQLSAIKLNGLGHLTTIEGSEQQAKLAQSSLRKINCKSYVSNVARFKDALPKILKTSESYDFVFIDGHHDRLATKEYFEMIYPYLSDTAIVIFDDINWSKGMQEVWKEVCMDARINASFDTFFWGICLIDKKTIKKDTVHYAFVF